MKYDKLCVGQRLLKWYAELTPFRRKLNGTLKLRTSFAKFANLPELMAMYKEFADVQSADKLHLPRPELKTCYKIFCENFVVDKEYFLYVLKFHF